MNFQFDQISSLFFALVFIFVILMTIGFYVNFKRDQWQKRKKVELNPIRGRFFVRYVPEEIQGKYKNYLGTN